MKKIILFVLVAAIFCIGGFIVYNNFLTVKLSSSSDFTNINRFTRKVELTNDIDFYNKSLILDTDFNGVFEGNGHTISGITNLETLNFNEFMDNDHHEYSTIFRNLGKNAEFKNVKFINCKISASVVGSYKGNRYISLLCGENNGSISNVSFENIEIYPTDMEDNKFSPLYAGVVTGINNGIITNITLDNCWLKADGSNTNSLKTNLEEIGMICGLNNNYIGNTILNDSVIQSFSAGGVTYSNLGLIENVANISMLLYSNYENNSFDGLKRVGGIAAYNANNIKNSYCFDAKLEVVNNASDSFNEESCNFGGLVGENVNSGYLTQSYFHGELKFTNMVSSNVKVGAICGQNYVDLYSNFSDAYIIGNGSLTVANDKGNAFINNSSFAIKFGNQTRLTGTSSNTYGSNEWAYNVDINTSNYSTSYYTDSTTTEYLDWNKLLEFKGFLSASNYEINKFYPTLKDKIGSSYNKIDYQEFVSDYYPA